MDFHVGDFVKLRKGGFGYIDRICSDNVFSWKCVYGPYAGEDFFGDIATEGFEDMFEQIGMTIFEQKYKPIEQLSKRTEVPSEYTHRINEVIDAVNKINEQLAKER